ncbi:MFS transporter [Oricola sp.]|uniref:MFS transporter n=1 Tax=Oricola sp. TaxID=1979950 RepID=UPI003BAD7E41
MEREFELADGFENAARDAADSQGWLDLFSRDHVAATATVSLGVALFAFNEFFVATALPSAIGELGGARLISWAFTFFLVFAIVGGLAAANLKARLGARNALIGSALVFLAGSAVTVVAPNMPVLVFGRALQGLGEGIVAAICYALIPVLFPARLVQKVFGFEAVVWAVAAFGGPLVAGIMTDLVSWRAAFALNIAMGGIFLALVPFAVARGGQAEVAEAVPTLRLVLVAAGILVISSAATAHPWLAIALFVVAVPLLLLSFQLDRNRADAILPAAAFRLHDLVGAGLWVVLLMPLAQAAGAVFMVFGFQSLWGLGATMAGALAATFAVTWSLSAILVASVLPEPARLRAVAIGPVLLTGGMVAACLGIWLGEIALVVTGQAAMGLGFGINWGPLCELLMVRASPADRDRTSAMLPTLQTTGYAIGAATFGLVANLAGFAEPGDTESIRAGIVAAYASAALVAIVSVVYARRLLRLAQ